MKVGFFTKIPVAIASLLASSTAFSAMDMDSRVSRLENQMQQMRTENAMGTYGTKTANARPEVGGRSWFLTLDVLLWHAKVGGTEYAYSDNDPKAKLPVKGRTKDIDFEWDWGLRVGAGYNFDHDGWDAGLQYTWFDTNGSDSTRSGLNSSVVPLRGSSRIVATEDEDDRFIVCDSAKTQYDLEYQGLELELGRAYFVSGKLSLRPHWGVKSAWIDQEQITRYTGGSPFARTSDTSNLGLGISTVHIKDECDFWGLGPRAGVDSKWHLGSGFSLFGNIAGSLLFSYFDVDHQERWTTVKENRINLHANRHAFSPSVQFALGLRYDQYIHNNKQHIGVGLGFDGQYWWRQNQVLKVDDTSTDVIKYERYSEDLSLHGVTLDVKFDF